LVWTYQENSCPFRGRVLKVGGQRPKREEGGKGVRRPTPTLMVDESKKQKNKHGPQGKTGGGKWPPLKKEASHIPLE